VSAGGERGDELRTLVHDLRTPLTIVEGFSDLLVRHGAELAPEQRDEYAQRIAEAARELRALVYRAAERG
jgi:K+-sensing histidine kinase KdpD